VKAGSLKILAVSSGTRAPSAPDVPTVKEAAQIDNFDFTLWAGIFAPRATPKEVVMRLNSEINKILVTPDTKERFAALGAEIRIMSAEQMAAFTRSESEKYVGVIKETGVKPE
jgi:tripartite-type tricarboxylate transporter receptor subunit TctC